MKNDKLFPFHHHPMLVWFAASIVCILGVTLLDFLACALRLIMTPTHYVGVGFDRGFSPYVFIFSSLIMLANNLVVLIIWLGLLLPAGFKRLVSKLKTSIRQSEKWQNQLRVN